MSGHLLPARATLAACAAGAALALVACSDAEPVPRTSTAPAGGLLSPVAAYVDSVNAEDLDGLAGAFATDAELVDVGRRFQGREAIRGWADREVIGGTLTVVRVVEQRDGYQKLLVRFAPGGVGGFDAHYAFTIAGTFIARADLTYAQ